MNFSLRASCSVRGHSLVEHRPHPASFFAASFLTSIFRCLAFGTICRRLIIDTREEGALAKTMPEEIESLSSGIVSRETPAERWRRTATEQVALGQKTIKKLNVGRVGRRGRRASQGRGSAREQRTENADRGRGGSGLDLDEWREKSGGVFLLLADYTIELIILCQEYLYSCIN